MQFFLGYSIKTYRNTNIKNIKGKLVRTAGYQIIIGIDMDRMMDRLTLKGFCRLKSDHRPIAKYRYSVLTIEQIIDTYNYIIRGVGNYYLPVVSRVKDMIRVVYILEYSAYMTLAKKYNTKISKIRGKYGKPLTVSITQLETMKNQSKRITIVKKTLLSYLTLKKNVEQMLSNSALRNKTLPLVTSDIFNPMNRINWRTLRNLNSCCCICGSMENVELHHVRSIKKDKVEGFNQVLKQINHKTIPLCKPHHYAADKGLLKDIKVKDLYFLEEYLA